MCGIIGICSKSKLDPNDIQIINKISLNLKHRGPDQSSDWINEKGSIYFSHRRLSINDLTEQGTQPMMSESGRYVIIFNGEIYNFLDLKKNHINPGYNFKSSTDTEVVLAVIERYGLLNSVKKFNGMFAFALYDLKLNKIFLVRDMMGQKPLYYYKDNGIFFFTSELRGINLLNFKKQLSYKALQYFFQLSYIPAPYTIYKNIYKLRKGCIFELNLNNFDCKEIKIEREKNFYNLKDKNFKQKIKTFDNIFEKVSSDHLISDVNNGTLLSGGIDSSLVTFYANRVSKNKINSYCVKSIDNYFDESKYAEKIAKKIGSNHNTLEFSKNDFFHEVTKIHKVYDEPFGDSSQIPTYLLFKSVKKNIKVALSGDGGDEVFLGYNRYLFLNEYYSKLKHLNFGFRKFLSKIINIFPERNFNKINNILNLNYFNFGNKISKVSSAMRFKNLEEFYFQIIRQDYNFNNIIKIDQNKKINFLDKINFDKNLNDLQNFQRFDLDTYLCDDIFVKVDRASMYNSVESRAPFVDTRVFDFSEELDITEKIKKKNAKYFLKKVLEDKLPECDFNRPKMGFGNPIGIFLNHELNKWSDDLINKNNEGIENIINLEQIQKIWKLHQNKKKDYSSIIWNFLVFKNWYLENDFS